MRTGRASPQLAQPPAASMLTRLVAGLPLLLFGMTVRRMNPFITWTQRRQIVQLRKPRKSLQEETDGLLEARRTAPRLRRISGGSSLEPRREHEALRALIRLWLAQGLLPTPGDTWAGPGTGELCVVCGEIITPSHIEYEIGHRAGRLYAHQPCFALWAEEAAQSGMHATSSQWGSGLAAPPPDA